MRDYFGLFYEMERHAHRGLPSSIDKGNNVGGERVGLGETVTAAIAIPPFFKEI